jgi:hypothetical protein
MIIFDFNSYLNQLKLKFIYTQKLIFDEFYIANILMEAQKNNMYV